MTDPTTAPTVTPDGRPILVLPGDGRTLHTATCWIARQQARITGWTQLQPDSSDAIARQVVSHDLAVCRKCKPISRLAWWEKYHRRQS